MSKNYKVLRYHPEFKNQIIDLQSHLWSPDKRLNSNYLEWKYNNNPYIEKPIIYLVLYDNRVVGMRGMYGAKWQFGQQYQTSIVPCAGDLVIHPDHRNRGLFTYLMSVAMDDLSQCGHKYVFNLSASPKTLISSLGIGWHSIGSLQTMYWLSESYNQWNYPSKRFFLSSDENDHPFHSLDRNNSKDLSEVSQNVSIDCSPKPEEMAELLDRINNNDRIKHVRDQQYFKWRFQNPLSQYRFLYWNDTRLEGYIVLQTSVYTDNICWISIVDIEASSEIVLRDLLNSAINFGKFGFITIWTSTLKEDINSLLIKTGFKILKKKIGVADARPTVLVGSTNSEILNEDWVLFNLRLLDLKNWDIRMIFSDTY